MEWGFELSGILLGNIVFFLSEQDNTNSKKMKHEGSFKKKKRDFRMENSERFIGDSLRSLSIFGPELQCTNMLSVQTAKECQK